MGTKGIRFVTYETGVWDFMGVRSRTSSVVNQENDPAPEVKLGITVRWEELNSSYEKDSFYGKERFLVHILRFFLPPSSWSMK